MTIAIRPGSTLDEPAAFYQGAAGASPRLDLTGYTIALDATDLPFDPLIVMVAQPASHDFRLQATAAQTRTIERGAQHFVRLIVIEPSGRERVMPDIPIVFT